MSAARRYRSRSSNISGRASATWRACAINARNTDGKYVGIKRRCGEFTCAGKLDRFLDTPKDVRELCKDAVFAPFPELERLTR